WPLPVTIQLVLVPWLAILVYELAGEYGERFWLGLFVGLLVLQGLHFVEHLIQMVQLHVLNLKGLDARGLISTLDVEWVHFVFNLIEVALLVGGYRSVYGLRFRHRVAQPAGLEARLAGLEAQQVALGASLEATHRALLGVGERLEVLCQALLEGHGGEPSWVLQRAYHQGPVAAHAPHRELGTVEAVGSPGQALHQ